MVSSSLGDHSKKNSGTLHVIQAAAEKLPRHQSLEPPAITDPWGCRVVDRPATDVLWPYCRSDRTTVVSDRCFDRGLMGEW